MFQLVFSVIAFRLLSTLFTAVSFLSDFCIYSLLATSPQIIYYYRDRSASSRLLGRMEEVFPYSAAWFCGTAPGPAAERYGVGMYIIAGLGNPGREYVNTRHNVGFDVLDRFAAKENIPILEKRHKAVIGKGTVAGVKCILAKPWTYMNLSGECIRELVNFYKVDEKTELIVISDDVSLEPGHIRIRKKGSAGGHNGLKNIIANLGHDTFIRVKMGVGEKPAGWDLADHVLGRFSQKDREAVDQAAERAADAVRMIIAEGPDAAMNRYNGAPKEEKSYDSQV